MKINEIDISRYSARVQSFVSGPSSLTSSYFVGPGSMYPVFLSAEPGLRELKISCEVKGDSWKSTNDNISELTAALTGKMIDLSMEDGCYYFAILTKVSAPEIVLPEKQYVTYTLQGLRHGERRIHTLTASGEIVVDGTIPAECIVTITPAADLESVKIMGVTVQKITAGQSIVIDGIAKKVTQDGINKFGDTDLIEFPKLKSGKNQIEISAGVSVQIEYYPLYL